MFGLFFLGVVAGSSGSQISAAVNSEFLSPREALTLCLDFASRELLGKLHAAGYRLRLRSEGTCKLPELIGRETF